MTTQAMVDLILAKHKKMAELLQIIEQQMKLEGLDPEEVHEILWDQHMHIFGTPEETEEKEAFENADFVHFAIRWLWRLGMTKEELIAVMLEACGGAT
jgi:hypothetical protein